MKITKALIEKVKSNPTAIAESMSDEDLTKLLTKLSDAYYNTDTPLVEDSVFDILFDALKIRDPTNNFFKEAGAPVKVERKKVKLVYPMGSLNKIKPTSGDLDTWVKKFKGYINVGNSTLLPKDASIRGELIIKRENFEKIKDQFKNIRNTVSGVVNSKTLDTRIAKLVDFVAYSILNPSYSQEKQMLQLEEWMVNVVEYKTVKTISTKILEEYFKDRRKNSMYDVDGIVCIDSSKVHKLIPGYPEYGFAFKMVLDDQYTIATIKKIIWEPSMDSYLKPVIEIDPVELGGTTVTFATAHNAKMVYDNKLGKGAKIKIVRSGDVIPYIMEVTQPAKKPDMPDIPYVWNETEVDIMIDYDEEIDEEILDKVKVKLLTHFFKYIGVKFLSEGLITKLVENGYDSISEILGADEKDLYTIDGLGKKSITKIYKEINDKMKTVNLYTFMAATHLFGRGFAERRIKEILKVFPNILHEKWTKKELKKNIMGIDGFSDITASQFAENLEEFKQFCIDLNKIYDISHITKKKDIKKDITENKEKGNDKLKGKTVVFTGVRDKDLELYIENSGGKVSSSVSKNTNIVIHSDNPDTSNSKYEKAKELKIKLISITDFKKEFKL